MLLPSKNHSLVDFSSEAPAGATMWKFEPQGVAVVLTRRCQGRLTGALAQKWRPYFGVSKENPHESTQFSSFDQSNCMQYHAIKLHFFILVQGWPCIRVRVSDLLGGMFLICLLRAQQCSSKMVCAACGGMNTVSIFFRSPFLSALIWPMCWVSFCLQKTCNM